jgi:hypothetical protein
MAILLAWIFASVCADEFASVVAARRKQFVTSVVC